VVFVLIHNYNVYNICPIIAVLVVSFYLISFMFLLCALCYVYVDLLVVHIIGLCNVQLGDLCGLVLM